MESKTARGHFKFKFIRAGEKRLIGRTVWASDSDLRCIQMNTYNRFFFFQIKSIAIEYYSSLFTD